MILPKTVNNFFFNRRLSISLILAALFAVLFYPAFSAAQTEKGEAVSSEGKPEVPPSFTMNMREADIRGFIQWIADRIEKNIIIHRSVRGTATVISSRPVSKEEAYELFLTVLQLNGFSAVESDGTIKVIPDAEAKTSDIPFAGNETQRGEIVTAIIDLQHSDASQFVGTIRPLIPASAHLAAYAPTNVLIVADTARSVDKIHRLVDILDKKEGEKDLEIVPVIHASADDILQVIETVSKALDGGEKGAKTPAQSPIDLSVDKRSNSILLIGNKKKRDQMKKLIARLDTPLDGSGNTQVVYLNYIDAEEIKSILQSVGDSILKESKTEGVKSFSIESSETTNALIISAPPALMNSMKSVISKLDIQRAQVLIEAVIVQVSGDAGDDFGIIWGASDIYDSPPDGGVAGINVSPANSFNSLIGAITDDDGDINVSNSNLASGILSSAGLTFGYLEDGNLLGALRLIATRNKSNIMSTPSVVALDNEEARLLVGQNLPFITGSSTSSGADVTNPFQTIQRQDVGITLNVTPRINQGDAITLEIEQTTENVASREVRGASDLVTDKTEIKTSALIKDGEVLVLGGLIREDEVKGRSQVPILGNIPVLGRLFRSSSVRKEKRNLMVFIRPIILKDRLQIEGITAQRYAFMRDQQMQKALSSFIKYSDRPLLDEFETYSPSSKSEPATSKDG